MVIAETLQKCNAKRVPSLFSGRRIEAFFREFRSWEMTHSPARHEHEPLPDFCQVFPFEFPRDGTSVLFFFKEMPRTGSIRAALASYHRCPDNQLRMLPIGGGQPIPDESEVRIDLAYQLGPWSARAISRCPLTGCPPPSRLRGVYSLRGVSPCHGLLWLLPRRPGRAANPREGPR
jgi:hypothetical protein